MPLHTLSGTSFFPLAKTASEKQGSGFDFEMDNMKRFAGFYKLTFAAILLAAVGCGGDDFGTIGKITGTLKLDGTPVPKDTKVLFQHPTEGYAGFGIIDESGSFEIEWRRGGKTYNGLPVGTYQVMVVAPTGANIDDVSADDMLDGKEPNVEITVQIPPKYLRASTSGLSYEVKAGDNNFDIQISSE